MKHQIKHQRKHTVKFVKFGLKVSGKMLFKSKTGSWQFVVVVVVDQLRLLYLCRGLPKEASGEVSLYLAQ